MYVNVHLHTPHFLVSKAVKNAMILVRAILVKVLTTSKTFATRYLKIATVSVLQDMSVRAAGICSWLLKTNSNASDAQIHAAMTLVYLQTTQKTPATTSTKTETGARCHIRVPALHSALFLVLMIHPAQSVPTRAQETRVHHKGPVTLAELPGDLWMTF